MKKYDAPQSSSNDRWKCDQCSIVFYSKGNLVKHQASHEESVKIKCEPEIKQECQQERIKIENEPNKLDISKTHKFERQWENKTEIKKIGQLSCKKCGYVTNSLPIYLEHRQSHEQDGSGKFKCDQCDFTTDGTGKFNQHILKHKKEQKFQCNQCDYTCHTKIMLELHNALKHQSEEAFGCGACRFKTISNERLQKHMRTCPPLNRTFKCYDCQEEFKGKTELKKHRTIHDPWFKTADANANKKRKRTDNVE